MNSSKTAAQVELIQDSIAFLTAVWTDHGCLDTSPEVVSDSLGDVDYQRVAFGVAGIAQYFANAVARLEGKMNDVLLDGREVLADMATQVAAQAAALT